MSDITMCRDDECPHRARCYRHEAEPCEWQSYFCKSPRRGTQCGRFWPVERDPAWREGRRA